MRLIPAFILPVLLLTCGGLGRAATMVADLGQRLAYLRPAEAKADLQVLTASAAAGALVLDLRRATFAGADAQAWLAALRGLPAGKTARLVLISPATALDLLAGLARGVPGCITIGRSDGGCHPDVVVVIDADADAKACDALANGTTPDGLVIETLNKPRHDEVELGRQHAAGKTPEGDTGTEAPSMPRGNPPPNRIGPVDAVLQRAVEIDRGLVALGKVAGSAQAPSTTNR